MNMVTPAVRDEIQPGCLHVLWGALRFGGRACGMRCVDHPCPLHVHDTYNPSLATLCFMHISMAMQVAMFIAMFVVHSNHVHLRLSGFVLGI